MTTLKQILVQHGVSIHGDVVRAITSATYIYEMCGCGAFPLRASGIRILNYLDDWLVLAHSEDVLTSHKLHYVTWKSRGLCVNKQKSVLRPSQSIMYLGVQLDSISMWARLSQERIQDLMSALMRLGCPMALKEYQRLLGWMAAAASVCHLSLLYIRPIQIWLKTQVPRKVWKMGHAHVVVPHRFWFWCWGR